jgi:hypothetical protein
MGDMATRKIHVSLKAGFDELEKIHSITISKIIIVAK